MGGCAEHATMTPLVHLVNVVDELQVVKLTHAHTNTEVLYQVAPESQVVPESQVAPVLYIPFRIFLVTEVTDMDLHIQSTQKSTKHY